MKIYTLRHPMTGSHGSILNGKMFYINFGFDIDEIMKHSITSSDYGKYRFIDVESPNECIWTTSSFHRSKNLTYTADGIIIKTDRGTIYDLIDVSFLLPSMTKVINDDSLEDDD